MQRQDKQPSPPAVSSAKAAPSEMPAAQPVKKSEPPPLKIPPVQKGQVTIAVSIKPNYTQAMIDSQDRAAAVFVTFAPPNVSPLNAPWRFEFNLVCNDTYQQ